jgi:hypothetical protein
VALQSLVRSWWIACWTPTDDLDDLLQLGWRKPSDDLVHALRFERQIAAITVSDTLSAAAQRNDSSIPWVLHREHDAFGQTFQPLTAGARRHSLPYSLKREKCDGHQRRSQHLLPPFAPLLGCGRTYFGHRPKTAFDPTETLAAQDFRSAKAFDAKA